MSYGWWMDKHTRHHANPNHEDHDPDVAPDVLVWSTGRPRGRHGLAAVHRPPPGCLFFPLLAARGLDLHVSSVRALLRRRR